MPSAASRCACAPPGPRVPARATKFRWDRGALRAPPIPTGTTHPRARLRVPPARLAWRAAATFGTGHNPGSFLLPGSFKPLELSTSQAAPPAWLALPRAGLGATVWGAGHRRSPCPAPRPAPRVAIYLAPVKGSRRLLLVSLRCDPHSTRSHWTLRLAGFGLARWCSWAGAHAAPP